MIATANWRPPKPKRKPPAPKAKAKRTETTGEQNRPPRPKLRTVCHRCGRKATHAFPCRVRRLATGYCRRCRTYFMGKANAVLTDTEALYVYNEVRRGRSRTSVARELGVSVSVPEKLARGLTYRHLNLEPLS